MNKEQFLATYKKELENGSTLKYDYDWLVENLPKSIKVNGNTFNFLINWCFFSVSGGFYNFNVSYSNEVSFVIATKKFMNLNETLDDVFDALKNFTDYKLEY